MIHEANKPAELEMTRGCPVINVTARLLDERR